VNEVEDQAIEEIVAEPILEEEEVTAEAEKLLASLLEE
jgi:hypothetical protein